MMTTRRKARKSNTNVSTTAVSSAATTRCLRTRAHARLLARRRREIGRESRLKSRLQCATPPTRPVGDNAKTFLHVRGLQMRKLMRQMRRSGRGLVQGSGLVYVGVGASASIPS